MSYLIDTNVLSEARKARADSNVRAWFESVSGADIYLSVLVVGEIRRGIDRIRRRDSAQADVYEAWLTRLRHDYADRLLPVTTAAAEEWGKMNVPDPIPAIDGLMAATAKVHNLTFVTRNVADLRSTGVRMLNPFEQRAI